MNGLMSLTRKKKSSLDIIPSEIEHDIIDTFVSFESSILPLMLTSASKKTPYFFKKIQKVYLLTDTENQK